MVVLVGRESSLLIGVVVELCVIRTVGVVEELPLVTGVGVSISVTLEDLVEIVMRSGVVAVGELDDPAKFIPNDEGDDFVFWPSFPVRAAVEK